MLNQNFILFIILFIKKLKCIGSTIAEGIAVKEVSIPYAYIKDKMIVLSQFRHINWTSIAMLVEKVVVRVQAQLVSCYYENQKI